MPNITKTISLLDELRGKATQGRWEDKNRGTVFPIDKPKDDWMVFETYPQSPETEEEERRAINNAKYIATIHNNYEALRQAALDGERYRKAGEAMRQKLEERIKYWGFENHECITWAGKKEHPEQWSAYCGYELDHGIEAEDLQEELSSILTTYRQAVEQKEV